MIKTELKEEDIKLFIKEYYKLKENKEFVGSIDKDFFFGLVDYLLQSLENKDKLIEYWKNGFSNELDKNRTNVLEIIQQDNKIERLKELEKEHQKENGKLQVELTKADEMIKEMTIYIPGCTTCIYFNKGCTYNNPNYDEACSKGTIKYFKEEVEKGEQYDRSRKNKKQ